MQNKMLGKLGLCKKAGKLIVGAKEVREAMLEKRVFLVLTAKDVTDNTYRPIERTASECGVRLLLTEFSKSELGGAIGYADVAVVGIKDRGFAKSFDEKKTT